MRNYEGESIKDTLRYAIEEDKDLGEIDTLVIAGGYVSVQRAYR